MDSVTLCYPFRPYPYRNAPANARLARVCENFLLTRQFFFRIKSIMKFQDYIEDVREITLTQAAQELGYSKQHISNLCLGVYPPSMQCFMRISTWSGGKVTFMDFLNQNAHNVILSEKRAS